MKICNHAGDCSYHEKRCEHRVAHSDFNIFCNLELRKTAGLQPNCYHYKDQACIQVKFKETK